MGSFILRRTGVMLLTALCLTLVVFFMTNLYPNLEKLAKTQGNFRMTEEAVESWLTNRGYTQPFVTKYGEWLGILPGYVIEGSDGEVRARCSDVTFTSIAELEAANLANRCGILQGDWGFSTVFKVDVGGRLWESVGLTGYLMMWSLLLTVPLALAIGVLAGMKEGSRGDRSLSTFSIVTSATPEYVSGVVLIAVFASSAVGLQWFRGSAAQAMRDPTFENFFLPVLTIALYNIGYIARMTRASMTEVMTAQYIRTARLKGVRFMDVVLKHALRNALIAPFTVIVLQIPYLLTGVVITETLFNYKGFGWLLVQAASNNDIEMLLGVSVVSVVIVLATQLISDIGYVYLNPRIRIT
ncbi:MAG: ABC transporter permease [Pseudomonadota bacterium]